MPAPPRAVIGAPSTTSLSGRLWRVAQPPAHAAARLAHSLGVPELLGRILAARGITADAAPGFLAPTLRAMLPDPSCLTDMDRLAARLAQAVIAQQTVGIFGDYDVDGACATTLLADLLAGLGCPVLTHVPDRMTEGYGPNPPALAALVGNGARLVVCVDCGTSANAALASLAGQADCVVLDHHLSPHRPAAVAAIVNPNTPPDQSGLGQLCATGLVFMAGIALLRALRAAGWFATRPEPDLLATLDLVALATVCDMMPLTGLNRAFVAQGLKIMAANKRPGLAALLHLGQAKLPPSTATCGFVLGPRINAGGRIAAPDLGVKLLRAQNPAEADGLAALLDSINRQRQTVEADMQHAAMAQASAQHAAGHAVLLVAASQWHPGVVGIVAGRLKEKFNRPACVAALADGIARGSGRSVPGFDLGAAILAARDAGLLLSGGGHAMACGFAVAESKLPALRAFLDTALAGAAALPAQPPLDIDAILPAEAATLDTAAALARLEPFGPANPEPVLAMPRMTIAYAQTIGRDGTTIRLGLISEAGTRLQAIAFRAANSPLGEALLARATPLTLAGNFRAETYNNQPRATFSVLDAAIA